MNEQELLPTQEEQENKPAPETNESITDVRVSESDASAEAELPVTEVLTSHTQNDESIEITPVEVESIPISGESEVIMTDDKPLEEVNSSLPDLDVSNHPPVAGLESESEKTETADRESDSQVKVETPELEMITETKADSLEKGDINAPLLDSADVSPSEEEEMEVSFTDQELGQLKTASLEQLLEMAKQASENESIPEAAEEFRKVRPYLQHAWTQNRQSALNEFVENGGEAKDFEFDDASKKLFDQYYKVFAAKRDAFRKKVDEERNQNLIEKRKILAELKLIVDEEETSQSLNKIKDIQSRWKAIRGIPMEHREELSNQYNHFLDVFYGNHSQNNELKDLDRRKNRDAKLKLVEKMGLLMAEKSHHMSLAQHKLIWEEWRNIGPVPEVFKEELYKLFKKTGDEVYEEIQKELNALDEIRKTNLDAKIILCEKAEEFSRFNATLAKDWIEQVPLANQLFEQWKAVGPVPQKESESIWNRFKQALDLFYLNKNNFFKLLQAQKNQNLKEKAALCEKAEALMNEENWNLTTKEFIKLQEDWKKIGPIPEKSGDKLWKRFRHACDNFFSRKNEHFSSLIQDQTKNLEAKQEILERLEELVKTEDNEDLSDKIKNLQDEWNTYGFVPIKQKEAIQKRFKEALDALYGRIRKDFASNSRQRHRSQYEVIARSTEGNKMLSGEEKRIQDRIRILKADIDTLQNNIGFLSNSKNAANLTKLVNEQIAQNQKKLSGLMDQLRVLRDVKTVKPAVEKETVSEVLSGNPEPEN